MIDDIRNILHGNDGDKIEVEDNKLKDDADVHGALPDLYSLRRSPFYQIKIV